MIHQKIQEILKYKSQTQLEQIQDYNNKQPTDFIKQELFELEKEDFDMQLSFKQRNRLRNSSQQIEILFKPNINDQNLVKHIVVMKERQQIIIYYKYTQIKLNSEQIKIFNQLLYKLVDKCQAEIKIFIRDSYLNFSHIIFFNQNFNFQQINTLINKIRVKIIDLIQILEQAFCSHNYILYENQLKCGIQNKELPCLFNLNFESTSCIQLLTYISILEKYEISKLLTMQIFGNNNLYSYKYYYAYEVQKDLLNKIQKGNLRSLEQQINNFIRSFDSKIQSIFASLFISNCFEQSHNKIYQLQKCTRLSQYFENQQQLQETFETRLKLFVQVFCVFLLKNQLNFDSTFPQKDVIHIDSEKQIKLDMLKYICDKNQKKKKTIEFNSLEDINYYFDQLLPEREKQIYIGKYNLSSELQNIKSLLKKNDVDFKSLILILLKIENQITRINELVELIKKDII